MNDYIFWNSYLNNVARKIEKLADEKDIIYADFHMHTDYSSDGKQTLEEIIERANQLGIDIIAITDHDSIGVYDDLYEYLKEKELKSPIIVPGIEFTVQNHEYGSQCHILQLMINPKEEKLMKDVEYNNNAMWNRSKIQFKRIDENKTLQYFFDKYDIKYSLDDYKRFLSTYKRAIPEYSTLCDYLLDLLSEKGISTWDILDKLEELNVEDECEERRNLKEKRYKVLREKYKDKEGASTSSRFLLSMLAVKGVDDDYFPGYESSGSLSVNNFGELKIEELNKEHCTIFAHPNEDKIWTINNAIKLNDNICGLEYNKQSNYKDDREFYNKLNELDLLMIIGSDSHTKDSIWYEDMSFYKIEKDMLKRFVQYSKKYFLFGVNKNDVVLANSNSSWKEIYEIEKQRLDNLIGSYVLQIEHVGSTAIPGLKAKPIIDISIAVNKLDDVLKFKNILIENGYNFRDDNGVKGEYLFSKGGEDARTHYIHMVEKGSKRWNDHILFRDYLLKHPDAVKKYEELKENLAQKYKHERKKYTEGKAEFIEEILKKA